MKIAKSILLGEHVQANEVDYDDVHGFQIVCPCCAESVIKVVRPLSDGRDTHFFSHRQAGPTGAAECEIRVASISREERAFLDREARGQTMMAFQVVFRGALALDLEARGAVNPRKESARLRQAGLYEILYRSFKERLRADHELKKSLVDDPVIKNLWAIGDAHDVRVKTPFPGRIKRRCVTDMMEHLLTAQGDANLRHLFDCVVITQSLDAEHRRRECKRLPAGIGGADHIGGVVWQPNKMKAIKHLHSLPNAGVTFTTAERLDGIAAAFEQGARTVVDQFPFLHVLENHRAGHHPHRGLRSLYEDRERKRTKFDAGKMLELIEMYRGQAAPSFPSPGQ